MAATEAAAPRSFWRRVWGLVMFVLVVGALGASAYLYQSLRDEQAARAALARDVAAIGPRFDQFKGEVRDVGRQLSSTVFQEIDLTGAAGWQPIAGGFYVTDLAVAPAGKGVAITGKIINPTSVTHEAAVFAVRVGDHHATFSLPHVPPAIAQPFEVALPDVAPAAAHRAYFALEGSTIDFATSSTRKHTGGGPVDTDKLLR